MTFQTYHLNCLECGYDYWSSDPFPNYCPNCGLKQDYGIICSCYEQDEFGAQRCLGTKEIDVCDCGGNPRYCTFYEDRRIKND